MSVDNILYNNEWSAVTRIVFVAINGKIKDGTQTAPTAGIESFKYDSISAVVCDVNTTLVNSKFTIGEFVEGMSGIGPLLTISRLVKISFNSKKINNRNVAAWLGLAAVTNGYSILGAQPMFTSNSGDKLPVIFTTASNDRSTTKWTISQLKNFINVSTGALAITISRQWMKEKTVLRSRKAVLQFDPRRAYILLAPPLAVMVLILVISVTVVWFYRKDRIHSMYLVEVSDLVAFTQNSDISAISKATSGVNKESSVLGNIRVRYGITQEGQIGLGSADAISSFY
ncbi:hypothetical protein HYFRA_00006722 [Hymenoscyphus fraxineus]|uniref:Uncharacterized protein n=1 Tax=Hymenoscyphus fraxineus TaxID=746836 RepID=A0A9N9KTA5_9HELO|nr:hypothetical protein HYFRA_00006722 [Hymenoscyphus fraxineus]